MTDVKITVGAQAPAGIIHAIKTVAENFPGESPLYVEIETSDGMKTYHLGVGVDYEADFFLAVRELGVDLAIR